MLEKSECDSKNSKKFKGGMLGFPQYGVAVDVRQGDFLAMDVHEWHCNCNLICQKCNTRKCKKLFETIHLLQPYSFYHGINSPL